MIETQGTNFLYSILVNSVEANSRVVKLLANNFLSFVFDGSTTEEDITYLRGGSTGSWDFASWGSSITMGAAAGNTANVLGDINVTTVGVAANDTYLIGLEVQKVAGFNNHLCIPWRQ